MEPRGAVFVVVPEARPVTPCTPALVEGREATVWASVRQYTLSGYASSVAEG